MRKSLLITKWVETCSKPADFSDGHPFIKGRAVRHVTDPAADLGTMNGTVEPHDSRGSRIRGQQPEQNFQRRGFARTIFTEQRNHFALLTLERNLIEHGLFPEPLCHLKKLENGSHDKPFLKRCVFRKSWMMCREM